MSSMNKTPKTVSEMIDRLVELEKVNKSLAGKAALLAHNHDQVKEVALAMLNRSTKTNSFTRSEVQNYAEQILNLLNNEKRALKR